MKLKTIRIAKFRAIRSSEIQVHSELALIGQNSAGKSSVLRALNAFFNFKSEKDSFEQGRHFFQNSSTAEIDLVFSNVPVTCTIPKVNSVTNEIRIRLRYKKTVVWQVFTGGTWTNAPPDLHSELSNYINYVYVPMRRDHEVSGWGDDGLLKTAVEAWVRHHTSRRDSISPKVAEITQTIQRRAFDGLSKQLRKVTPINGAFTFNLEYAKTPDYSLLIRDLVLRVTEGSTTVDLEDCGSGTQSMTAFALYSYLAELEETTYILGIEEPEQNLHPQAQRELLESLRKLPMQVLFTTHSTVILDQLKHDEVVLCRRIPSTTRGFEVITTQLDSSFWSANGLDEDRYYQFYRRSNSEFFFSNFVILTESSVDAEILKELLQQGNVDPTAYGVSILSLDGVTSLPYAFHLFKALDLDFATVVDKDYFMPYLNDALETSRDSGGFPRYRKEYKSTTILNQILPNVADRTILLELLHSNHSRAMDMLEKSNVFCFKWSIEIDLVNSLTARQLLFDKFHVSVDKQNTVELLVNKKGVLKKLETLMPVVHALQPSNLPNSYKRLRKTLPEIIKIAVSIS